MSNTVFIQNIISPYRNYFFNRLHKRMNDFSVFYMGETEPDRNWDVSKFVIDYPHWIDKRGRFISVKGIHAHLNPCLVWRVLKDRSIKNVVLAVSWVDPNIMAICFAKRLHLTRKRLFFWAEANYTAEWAKKYNSKFKWWLKRYIFNSIDGGMVIPGRMSMITFEKWGIPLTKYIINPNTIDESSLYYKKIDKTGRKNPVFIMPFRLVEHIKGGLNFFRAIGVSNIRKATFIIAGDGEDRNEYDAFVLDNHLEDNIIIKGFCDSEQMSELYNYVDAMILPSFSDSSPLTIVEALYFHLPILCSNHCGNHFEAVEEGQNGYTFSPLDHNDIKSKYELFISRYHEWISMGEYSASLYESRFETERVINHFVAQYARLRK